MLKYDYAAHQVVFINIAHLSVGVGFDRVALVGLDVHAAVGTVILHR